MTEIFLSIYAVFRVSGFDELAETYLTVRMYLYTMGDKVDGKIPSQETGTYSTHFGSSDQQIINRLGWDGIGPSPVLTRALENAETLHEIKNTWDRVLSGDVPIGVLFRKLSQA